MRTIKIPKLNHDKYIYNMFHLDKHDYASRFFKRVENYYIKAYNTILDGSESCVYWDDMHMSRRDGSVSCVRHSMTRSVKNENCVQLTSFQVINDVIIYANYDVQISDIKTLLRETNKNGVTLCYLDA